MLTLVGHEVEGFLFFSDTYINQFGLHIGIRAIALVVSIVGASGE